MKTTLEVLTEARRLIEDEANWFGGGEATAKRCCALGAIGRAGETSNEYIAARNALARIIGSENNPGSAIVDFNDSHTHAEVLDLFDRAINKEKRD